MSNNLEKVVEVKSCTKCSVKFEITDRDLEFYDKISPIFNGEKYSLPSPTFCPSCRQQRRMSFRNERKLYRRTSSASGIEFISNYSPDKPYPVYTPSEWWSDQWDAMDYGIDFDNELRFSSQFKQLVDTVPHLGLLVMDNENSEYISYGRNNKNCYMIFASSQNEDSFYSRWIFDSENLLDCNNVFNSRNCYNCVDGNNINSCRFCISCIDSTDCIWSYNLTGCSYCIWCSNLNNKQYHIFNIKYSKDEYFKKKQELKLNANILIQAWSSWIHKSDHKINVEQSSGDYMKDTKSVRQGYDVEALENCAYTSNALSMDNSQDIDFQAYNTHYCYDVLWLEDGSHILHSYGAINSSYIYCSYLMFNSKNCFWCVGLKNAEYCILNKQYTKEEYEELVPKIIQKMQQDWEWWEFFPASISPFGYNETIAQEYYPLSKEEALEQWFNCSDYEQPFPKVEKIIPANKLPDNILGIPDDILNWAIECEVTKKPFRVIKQELDFYRKHNLPIPKRHPDQRHLDRMKLRNPRKLFERSCDKCGVEMETTYSPDRSEKVYCESCYNNEIY